MAVDAALKIESSDLIAVQEFEVGLKGGDRFHLHVETCGGEITKATLKGSGCPELLKILVETRPLLKGRLSDVPLPKGTGHASILVRELLLKARGEWNYPYAEEELCHCRAVSTTKVDQAIVSGCHTVFAVAKQTSAGTSCGNCRYDTERIIAYRLGR